MTLFVEIVGDKQSSFIVLVFVVVVSYCTSKQTQSRDAWFLQWWNLIN